MVADLKERGTYYHDETRGFLFHGEDKHLIAIEAKASTNVGKSDLRGLRSFAEYYGKKHRACIAYLGNTRKTLDGIELLPWQTLLMDLGL